MKEEIGILDFEIGVNDSVEITVKNIRGTQILENSLVVTSKNYDRVNNSFSLSRENGMGRCGYDYLIEVFKNGVRVKAVLSCFNCNRLINNAKTYYMDKAMFTEILSSSGFDVFDIKTYEFDSLEKGRAFWQRELLAGKIDVEKTKKPIWLQYDGQFISTLSNLNNRTADDYLRSIFGNEDFDVVSKGVNYYIDTTAENYDKYDGEKSDWSNFEKLELKIIYK